MTAGWQVIVYGLAFVAFVLAAAGAAAQTPRSWWPTLLSVGLALVTFVALWNASALYD